MAWGRQGEGRLKSSRKSHVKRCNINSDGWSAWQKINGWIEAIREGVEPSEQLDSPEVEGGGCHDNSNSHG